MDLPSEAQLQAPAVPIPDRISKAAISVATDAAQDTRVVDKPDSQGDGREARHRSECGNHGLSMPVTFGPNTVMLVIVR